MDVDSPVSRDPRLQNRPQNWPQNRPSLSTRLSQHEIQRLPSEPVQPRSAATDAQDDACGEQFIQTLSELVQTAVLEATHKSERERIQSRRSNTEAVLRKARNSAFPATVDFFRQTQVDEDRVLMNINAKIKQHEGQSQRLLDDLRDRWTASITQKPPKPDEKVPQLQRDLKNAIEQIATLREDVDTLLRNNEDLQTKLTHQTTTLENQKKAFASYTHSLGVLQTDLVPLKRDLNELSTLKKGIDDLPALKKSIDDLTTLKKDVDDISVLRQDFGKLSALTKDVGELSSLKIDMSEFSKRLELLEQRTTQPQEGLSSEANRAVNELSDDYKRLEQKTAKWIEKVDILTSSYQRISQLPDQVNQTLRTYQQKLDQLPNGQPANNPKLEKDVLSLKTRLDGLEEIQSTKDDMVFADMEDMKKILDSAQQGQKELSENLKQVSKTIAVDPVEPKLQALFIDVQRDLVEPINHALHSLEARYNNMTTEVVVQHMVVALQEMYPSADQIMKELPPLKGRLQQLETHANSFLTLKGELDAIRTEQKNIQNSIGPLLARYESFSPTEYQGMQASLRSIADKQKSMDTAYLTKVPEELRELHSKLENLMGKQTHLESTYHNRIAEDFQGIQSGLKSLTEDQSSMGGKFQSQTDLLQQIQSDLQSLAEKQSILEAQCGNSKADQNSLKNLLDRHESLNNRVVSLSNAYEKLSSGFIQSKTSSAGDETMSAMQRTYSEKQKDIMEANEKLKLGGLRRNKQPSAALSEDRSSQPRDGTPKTAPVQRPPLAKPARIDTSMSTNIKRRHPSAYSDDEGTPGPTPNSLTASPTVAGSDSRRKKKKKKRKRDGDGTVIQIDD
ncbi:hypothetical protein BJY04DRAFT_7634 [Aspergillus karnatakaensis]|uniref:uncharacterized protein n=1 Tax=Aspergillus karnatakaensis TaxID=1810916 RepID=UPI003CCDE0CD